MADQVSPNPQSIQNPSNASQGWISSLWSGATTTSGMLWNGTTNLMGAPFRGIGAATSQGARDGLLEPFKHVAPEVMRVWQLAGAFHQFLVDQELNPNDKENPQAQETLQELKTQLQAAITLLLDAPASPLTEADRSAVAALREQLALDAEGNSQALRQHLETVYTHFDSQIGIAAKINELVVQSENAVEKIGQATFRQVDQLKQKLLRPVHPNLSHAKDSLSKLQQEITYHAIKKSWLVAHTDVVLDAIVNILNDQEATCEGARVLDDDMQTLRQLLRTLSRLQEEALPRKEEVLPQMRTASAVLDRIIYEQSGIAPGLSVTVTQAEEQILTRVPMNAVNFHIGNDAEMGPIRIKPEEEAEPVTIGEFLSATCSGLGAYLQTAATDALSHKVVTNTASALLFALEGARNSIQGKEGFERPRAAMESLIQTISALKDNGGSVSELYDAVSGSVALLNSCKIYINGFRLPQLGTYGKKAGAPDRIYFNQQLALEESQQSAERSQRQGGEYWKRVADEEKEKFIENTKGFLTLKLIYENLCGLSPENNQIYYQITKEISTEKALAETAGTPFNSEKALRAKLFNRLEETDIGGLRKFFARIAYPVTSFLLNRFLTRLSSKYLDEAFNFIKQHKPIEQNPHAPLDPNAEVQLNSLKTSLVDNFSRYLTVLNGAYRRVATNPLPNETFSKMLQQELERPESNYGHTSFELYQGFAEILISKCTGNTFLGWIFKKIIGWEGLIQGIIDQSVGSLMDANGYTHALNSVLVDQLTEVLKILQNRDDANSESGMSTYSTPESKAHKAKLNNLVKTLFEILEKHNKTPDELKALLKGASLSGNIVKTVDDLFLQEVITSISDILSLAIKELLTEEQLHKLIYRFTSLVNTVYDSGKPCELDEMQKTETRLSQLTDEILNIAISGAIEEKFDFSGEKEQKATNRHIESLRQETQNLVDQVSPELDELEELLGELEGLTTEAQDQPGNPFIAKLGAIQQQTKTYHSKCFDEYFKNKTSLFNIDNKKEIQDRHFHLAQNLNGFLENITSMRKAQKEFQVKKQLDPRINGITEITNTITRDLCGDNQPIDKIDASIRQIQEIEAHLNQARAIIQDDQTRSLQSSNQILTRSLIQLQNSAKTMLFCQLQGESGGEDCLIAKIAQEKRASFGQRTPDSVKEMIQALKRTIATELDDAHLRIQLNTQIDAIQNSLLPAQIDHALSEFYRITREALENKVEGLDEQKRIIRENCAQIQNQLAQLPMLQHDYEASRLEIIRTSLQKAKTGITLMRRSYHHTALLSAQKNATAFIDLMNQESPNREDLQRAAESLSANIGTLLEKQREIFHHDGVIEETSSLTEENQTTCIEALTLLGRFAAPQQEEMEGGQEDEAIAIPLTASEKDQLKAFSALLKDLKDAQSEHNTFEPVDYINQVLFDMKGLQTMATGLVFERVKERTDGLLELLSREETYRYGLVHHMFLIPYLQHNNAISQRPVTAHTPKQT